MRTVPAFVACLLLLAPGAAPDPVARARAALAVHGDGYGLDGKPGSAAALRAYWDALTGKTLAYLNSHPGTALETLGKNLSTNKNDPDVYAVALGPSLIGLSLSYGATGDIVLIQKQGGHFSLVWDAARIGPEEIRRFPILKAWAVDAASVDCRTTAVIKADQWDRCGPLGGGFQRLAPDRAGHPRFLVDATYAQEMGETVGGQISIWTWDGRRATPLLTKSYGYMIEQEAFTRLDGDIVRVREKQDFRSFFSCGSCDGRQVEWSVRIGPDGVTDLGDVSLVPELDAVDGLLDAIRRDKPTAALASQQVVRLLRPFVTRAIAEARQDPDHYFSLGMLEAAVMSRRGGTSVLCFATDPIADVRHRPFLLTIEGRAGRPFVARAAAAPTQVCPR